MLKSPSRDNGVWTTCPRLLRCSVAAGFEPTTYDRKSDALLRWFGEWSVKNPLEEKVGMGLHCELTVGILGSLFLQVLKLATSTWLRIVYCIQHIKIHSKVFLTHYSASSVLSRHIWGGKFPPNFELPPRTWGEVCECNTCKLTECSKLTK